MGGPCYCRRAFLVLAALLAAPDGGPAAPVRAPALRAETVAAWVKSGARFGYMRTGDDGTPRFEADDFKANCPDLPAFAIEWEDFLHCARLPAIEVPFALLLSPYEFDHYRERPPPKKPPPGLVDIDVSNLLRVRYLSLRSGPDADLTPLLPGMQRFGQLETLELRVGPEILRKVADSPTLSGLKDVAVSVPLDGDYLSVIGGLKRLTRLRVDPGGGIDPKEPGFRGRLIGLSQLAGLPALRSLRLDWCRVLTDEELAEVAKIPDLRELNIQGCVLITAKGLNALAGAKKLEALDVAEGPATDGGWTGAGKMAALRRLRVGGPAVTDGGLGRIAAVPGLRHLTLKGCDEVTDAGYARLGAHRGLESLGLWFCKNLGEEGTKAIGTLKGLRRLRAGYCPGVTDDRLDHWADLSGLRELDLRGCTALTDAGVAKLGRFGRLEELHLWSCPNLTEKCLPAVCTLREMRVLEFYRSEGVKPDDRDMAGLGGLRHLRRLTLSNCRRVTAEGYRALARLPELEELGLGDCPGLTDTALGDLAGPGRLKVLVLSMTPRVTDAGLRALGPAPFRQLRASGCERVTADGIAAFVRAHPWCDVSIKPDWRPPGRARK